MHRLFSGDLKDIHGPTFGELASDHVNGEHRFLEGCLRRAFDQNSWEETISELMDIESVIRHCPALQNEANAIHTLIEAERALTNFSRAVRAA